MSGEVLELAFEGLRKEGYAKAIAKANAKSYDKAYAEAYAEAFAESYAESIIGLAKAIDKLRAGATIDEVKAQYGERAAELARAYV